MEHEHDGLHDTIRPCDDNLRSGLVLRERFVVRERIAATALSTVYRGYDRLTGRAVAIKRLSSHERPGGLPRASAVRAFVAEATLLKSIEHHQIPMLLDLFRGSGEYYGEYYMVTQYMAGTPLDQLLEGCAVTRTQALQICASLCDVVEALHRRSLVHADIKPNNIVVLPSGRVALLDFGLARRAGEPAAIDEAMGTVPYSPPEQWAGAQLGVQSDIYALGRVLDELFFAVSCPALRRAVQPALAAAPSARFASVAELRRSVASAYMQASERPSRRPLQWDVWQLAAIVAVIFALAVLLLR